MLWMLVPIAFAGRYTIENLEAAAARGLPEDALEAIALDLQRPPTSEEAVLLLRYGLPEGILREASGGEHPTEAEVAEAHAAGPLAYVAAPVAPSAPEVAADVDSAPHALPIRLDDRGRFRVGADRVAWRDIAPTLLAEPHAAGPAHAAQTAGTVMTIGAGVAVGGLLAGLFYGASSSCYAPGINAAVCLNEHTTGAAILDIASVVTSLTVVLPARLVRDSHRRAAVAAYEEATSD
jgi:hypothetical protein